MFLRDDQSFVKGADLKADLGRLDAHYSSLPEDVKRRGLASFASYPPQDESFLVTQLLDIMRALNPFTGAFYLEALQMSRMTREMFCLMEGVPANMAF